MILIAFMWARILSGPDKFKRVIKYQTLSTSFHGGFESTFWTNFGCRSIWSGLFANLKRLGGGGIMPPSELGYFKSYDNETW